MGIETTIEPIKATASADDRPRLAVSIWQLVNTFLPFWGLIYLMYHSLASSYWITLALGIVAGGLLVRIFIIQHDCGHGSFFRSRRANERVGLFCSLFTWVPFYYWRKQHGLHHATSSNLDRRGFGDITIYTLDEYLQLSRWDRLNYRFYRNPVVFLILGPLLLYLINNRTIRDRVHTGKRERNSVHLTNLAVLIFILGGGLWIGFSKFFLIAAPVLWTAGAAGIWIFYVQHQFEHVYWKRGPEWNFQHAGMQGSSFLKLPRILQWFSGNIGFHHVHHLKVTVPNYRLERVYQENPEYHDVFVVTLWTSIRHMFLSVWDEQQDRLISFKEVGRIERGRMGA